MIARLALAGLAVAGALAGVQTWRLNSLQSQVAEDKAAATESALLRERAARASQAAIDSASRKVTDAYLIRSQAGRVAANGVDAAYRSLLDAIAASGGTADDPAAACRTASARVGDLERLLAEVAGAAAEGGRHLARVGPKLAGLQEHAGLGIVPIRP